MLYIYTAGGVIQFVSLCFHVEPTYFTKLPNITTKMYFSTICSSANNTLKFILPENPYCINWCGSDLICERFLLMKLDEVEKVDPAFQKIAEKFTWMMHATAWLPRIQTWLQQLLSQQNVIRILWFTEWHHFGGIEEKMHLKLNLNLVCFE